MIREYSQDHCWQYDIRVRNRILDLQNLRLLGYSENDVNDLKVPDFTLQFEEKDLVWDEAKEFITRHEWLGRMGPWPTHIFTARYNGILAGVVVMDMPITYSKLVGENTRKIERLISRGACISWSPKNLASALIMFAIRWMTKNTRFRVFIAYSDPEAKELGTIYQACNFFYLGQKFGTKYQYQNSAGRWVSDRAFRCRSAYKRIAKELMIEWNPDWQTGNSVHFDRMPTEIAVAIKTMSKELLQASPRRTVIPKHKYAYILGKTKGETKRLKKVFFGLNPMLDYPKDR